MINLNDNELLLIGGSYWSWNWKQEAIQKPSNQTWLYSLGSSDWKRTGADLSQGRRAFACGKIYDSSPELTANFYIVASGGCTNLQSEAGACHPDGSVETRSKTTEMIEMVDQERYIELWGIGWRSGPDFPYKADGIASATTYPTGSP